jgi:hypothetical protein
MIFLHASAVVEVVLREILVDEDGPGWTRSSLADEEVLDVEFSEFVVPLGYTAL